MNPRLAILDLGTNTFHLLIAEVKPDKSYEILFKAEEFVKLGEEGVERIGDNAFQRGVEQMRKYKKVIDEFQPQQTIGFGTAAIRKASNGDDFIRAVKEVLPMSLQKISGDEEAELIYFGVRQAVGMDEHPVLVMDIGGGSTEFIIANRKKIFWKQSFTLGGSVLKQLFHQHEPISAAEQVNLLSHLQNELQPLLHRLQNFPVKNLIGASGSFDTLAQMITENFYGSALDPLQSCTEISLRDFYRVCELLIRSTMEGRLKTKGLIWFRAETIVVAAILAGFIVEVCNIRKITRSAFALKEGVLWKILRESNFTSNTDLKTSPPHQSGL